MPSGGPDFERAPEDATIHSVMDLAEQAARVGSIVTFHRGGEVYWLDDFEASVLKWDVLTSGTGAAVALSTVQSRNGVQSVLLTAGSDGGQTVQIFRSVGTPSGNLVGIEFSLITDSLPASVRLDVDFYDGTNIRSFRLFLDYTNDRVQINRDVGGLVTVLDPLDWFGGNFVVHTVKLVVNRSTGAYVRFFLDNRSVDLSNFTGAGDTNTRGPSVETRIYNNGDSGVNDTVYIDDFILTHNEP